MLMYFYWQLSCPLLFLILSTSPTPHYFLSPTTMSSPLIHLQPLSQLPLLHPLIPTVNSPSVYCFSLSCPTLVLTPYLSVDLVLHLSVWCKIKEGGMGKPQGEVNTLHACHSELHRALEIGVRSTNFSSEEKPTAFIHPSGLYVPQKCKTSARLSTSIPQSLGFHPSSVVLLTGFPISSKLKPTPLRSNCSSSLHSEQQISLCCRTAKPSRARDCSACRTIVSPVCTRFSLRKLLCPFSNTEIRPTEVRTAEPGGHPGGDTSSLARDRTGDQEWGLGGGIMNFTTAYWPFGSTLQFIISVILCLYASVSHHVQGRKYTSKVILRCSVKFSKSSTFKAPQGS